MTFPEISDRGRRGLVWTAPVIIAGVIALVVSMTGASSASTPKLRPLSAKQLIVAVERSTTTAFSGTISETTNLGLPSLPGDAQQASLSWQTFLSGTHSVRVWADGPDRQRLALIGELTEAEVVHNGRDVWTYTSHTNSASHTVLPARSTGTSSDPAGRIEPTPSAVADRLLKAITPSTAVSVGTARRVAGRPAYTLTLAPRDARSTIRQATIAVDAARFIPLQVQIFGTGSSPAISVGFSKISFHRPSAGTFTFHVPQGASMEPNPLTAPRHRHDGAETRRPTSPSGASPAAKPAVIGTGWTSVVELHDFQAVGGGMLSDATTRLADGARLLHTALVNAVILPDGRAFVGAVEPSALERIAAATPR